MITPAEYAATEIARLVKYYDRCSLVHLNGNMEMSPSSIERIIEIAYRDGMEAVRRESIEQQQDLEAAQEEAQS